MTTLLGLITGAAAISLIALYVTIPRDLPRPAEDDEA